MLQTAEELRVSVEALYVVSVFLSPHLSSDLRRNATATKMQVEDKHAKKTHPTVTTHIVVKKLTESWALNSTSNHCPVRTGISWKETEIASSQEMYDH